MDLAEIEARLAQTIEDRRLSRAERRAVRDILDAFGSGARERTLLLNLAFELARGELVDPDSKRVLEWLESVSNLVLAAGAEESSSVEALFCPGDRCVDRIQSLFGGARERVDVCVFTLTDDRIADAIIAAHRRGVPVRIVSDREKADDLGSDVDRLAGLGVPVAFDQSEHHMHHKFAIFDGRTVLSGSFNWTRAASELNEENIVISDDPRLVDAFQREFERLWQRHWRP